MNNYLNKESDVIYIAAFDSSESDKLKADFVCDGKSDQVVFQSAVDIINESVCGEIRGRRILLLSGNYYISDFPYKNACGNVAVMFGSKTNAFNHIGILFAGVENAEATTIHITEECYNKLDGNTCYSLFANEKHDWNHHVFKDLYVTVPDNQKNIVCFDGRFMGSMGLTRCKCMCLTKGVYEKVNTQLPVEGFVAFMGTYGSNNMWESKWEFCQAEGFGQGFAVGGEHLILIKCAALFGKYGFTFNNYFCDFGAIVHPLTLIGCADEANANLWKFGKNKYKQNVNAYNTTFEIVPEWFELSGNYAVEERPGDYVGHIDYVANHGFHTTNNVGIQFWAEGSGENFETVNNAHKKVCTSEERRTYAANIGQEVYDVDLMKKLTYIGRKGWVDDFGKVYS